MYRWSVDVRHRDRYGKVTVPDRMANRIDSAYRTREKIKINRATGFWDQMGTAE